MTCACPCQQEFVPRRCNQVYLNARHRQRDKDRRWPRKRVPVALRNGPTERQEAKASGVQPLPSTESPPEGKKAVRREVEARLAQLGLLAKIEFGEFALPDSELLTTFEVARFLRVSRETLCNWRRANHGPPFVKLSRHHLCYLRRGLGRWLRARIAVSAKEDRKD